MATLQELQAINLRILRLHHWKECVKLRKWADGLRTTSPKYMSKIIERKIRIFDEHANFHMKQVQVLNDFFDINDTAEKDAENGT